MLYINYSNRWQNLAKLLINNAHGVADVERPLNVLVNDRREKGQLQRLWAKEKGICMGIAFMPFMQWLEETTPWPRSQDVSERLLDGMLQGTLPVPEVMNYLGDRDGIISQRKMVKLSSQLSMVFDGYTRFRPHWFKRGVLDEKFLGGVAWQSEAWKAVGSKITPRVNNEPLHIFNRPFWPLHDVVLISNLAKSVDVHVYQFNPCQEYWEDGSVEGVLEKLGKRVAVSVRMLSTSASYSFASDFAKARASVLGALQNEVTMALKPEAVGKEDDSLQTWSVPSVRRELEVVADAIWTKLTTDATLSFSDFAISYPRHSGYSSLIREVFAARHHIPIALQSLSNDFGPDEVPALFFKMVKLPLGRFERPDVLAIVTHRLVTAALDDADPALWAQWTNDLGIFHGVDYRDHKGTYIDGDNYNWQQGLRRLALGAFMATPTHANGEVAIGNHRYAPKEVPTSDLAAAGAFVELVAPFLAECRNLKEQKRTRGQWHDFFGRWISTYIHPRSEQDDQGVEQLREALQILQSDSQVPVPYAVVAELITRSLAGLRMNFGGGGNRVTVGAIHPTQIGQTKVHFVLGLSQTNFPSKSELSALDARGTSPEPNDISPQDIDNAGLLSIICQTETQLVLSHVSRHPETGDEIYPASILVELEKRPGVIKRKFSLRGYQEENYPFLCSSRQTLDAHLAWRGESVPVVRKITPSEKVRRESQTDIPIYALRRFLESPLQGWASFSLGLPEAELQSYLELRDEEFELSGSYLLTRNVVTTHLCSPELSLEALHDDALLALARAGKAPNGVLLEMERKKHRRVMNAWMSALGEIGQASITHLGRPSLSVQGNTLKPLLLTKESRQASISGSLYPFTEKTGAIILSPLSIERRMNVARVRGFLDAMIRTVTSTEKVELFSVVSPGGLRKYRVDAVSREQALEYLNHIAFALVEDAHEYLMPADETMRFLEKPGKQSLRGALESAVSGGKGVGSQYGPVHQWRNFPVAVDTLIAEKRFGDVLKFTEAL